MTTDRELLQQAFDALGTIRFYPHIALNKAIGNDAPDATIRELEKEAAFVDDVIAALHRRLAQPEPEGWESIADVEPVAYMFPSDLGNSSGLRRLPKPTPSQWATLMNAAFLFTPPRSGLSGWG